MYVIVSIGGTMPLSKFGTILRFNTPCVMQQRMGLRKCKTGRSIHRVRISASFITRPTDQCHCLSMGAAKTSWRCGIHEQIQELRILPTMLSYPRRKFGLGGLTQTVLIGAKHCPTTIAPTLSAGGTLPKPGDICVS